MAQIHLIHHICIGQFPVYGVKFIFIIKSLLCLFLVVQGEARINVFKEFFFAQDHALYYLVKIFEPPFHVWSSDILKRNTLLVFLDFYMVRMCS